MMDGLDNSIITVPVVLVKITLPRVINTSLPTSRDVMSCHRYRARKLKIHVKNRRFCFNTSSINNKTTLLQIILLQHISAFIFFFQLTKKSENSTTKNHQSITSIMIASILKPHIPAAKILFDEGVALFQPGLILSVAAGCVEHRKYWSAYVREFIGTILMVGFTFSAGKWIGQDDVMVAWSVHSVGVILADYIGT